MKSDKKESGNKKSRRGNIFFLVAYFIPLGLVMYHCTMNDFSADRLLSCKDQFRILVETNWYLSVTLFLTIYFALVLSSAPFTVIFNLFAGYLFGSLFGALLADAAVVSGSYVLFRFSRSITQKIRSECFRLKMIETSSKKTFLMLLFLRLSPFFPASAINLGCGAFGVKANLFVLTTFFGSFPLILVYTLIGRHLGSINKISEIYDQKLIITLILLGLISLVPLLRKDIRCVLLNKEPGAESPALDTHESGFNSVV